MPTDPMPGGPSEAASNAAFDAHASYSSRVGIDRALVAAHDPALGTDRSVNEAWCRADQTRQIVEWLQLRARGLGWDAGGYITAATKQIAREFGGSDAV